MHIQPVGFISSCYREKFGIPRQPALVPLATATLELEEAYQHEEMLQGLESFSHIWLIFGFHATLSQGWKKQVRPPRLGGNKRVGVFASRSMYRPNGLGLSACKLDAIDSDNGRIRLQLSGTDLLDGTPVFDIKPYLPYADCIRDAQSAYAASKPAQQHEVIFSGRAVQQCRQIQQERSIDIQALIRQILQQDPRPAFHRQRALSREYGMKLYDFNVRWCYLTESKKTNENREVVKVLSLW